MTDLMLSATLALIGTLGGLVLALLSIASIRWQARRYAANDPHRFELIGSTGRTGSSGISRRRGVVPNTGRAVGQPSCSSSSRCANSGVPTAPRLLPSSCSNLSEEP